MSNDNNPIAITAFHDAPHLRELCLTGAPHHYIALPWIQLTRLEFWGDSAFSCVQILKETPNLEVLQAYLGGILNEEPSHPSHVILLPHLHTLIFAETWASELLGHLVLPSLKTIHVSYFCSHSLSSFLDLGVRSEWSPRSINLRLTEVNSCIVCLRSLPSVTQVEVEVFYGGDSNMDLLLLFLQKDDRHILPVLKTLTLRAWRSAFEPRRLREMLASRSTGAHDGEAKLKSFRLAFGPPAPSRDSREFVEELWSELRPVMDAGLEVFINVS